MLSVAEIAESVGVREHTVLEWIRRGDLEAYNVGRAANKQKPRWRIAQAALDKFLQARSNRSTNGNGQRRRRSRVGDFQKPAEYF